MYLAAVFGNDEDIVTCRALAPGPWFKSVTPVEYQKRFAAQLAELDPERVVARLQQLAGPGNTPVLACFEHAADITAGRCWCHRHLVALAGARTRHRSAGDRLAEAG
jgi:hypothetical protein